MLREGDPLLGEPGRIQKVVFAGISELLSFTPKKNILFGKPGLMRIILVACTKVLFRRGDLLYNLWE